VKELASLADQYAAARDQRLAAQRRVDSLKDRENELKASLMKEMQIAEVSIIGGKHYSVRLSTTEEPAVADWSTLYEYISQTGAFDLLQRRISPPAIRLRWEDDEQIPGLTTYPVSKISVSKVKT
jgi:hypothetical protein